MRISLLFLVFMVIAVASTCGAERATNNEPALIAKICSELPKEWQCRVEDKPGEKAPPHGLDEPLFRADFTNPQAILTPDSPIDSRAGLHPRIPLYFYDIKSKKRVLEVVEKERNYSWSIPIYFGETEEFIVITSPADVNYGIHTEDAKKEIRPMWEVLRRHIKAKEATNVEQLVEPVKKTSHNSIDGLCAGPENSSMRMRLTIAYAKDQGPDVYYVGVDLINMGKEPITLKAQWPYESDNGDYREFLKEYVSFKSFPEVMLDSAQTAGEIRTSSQPDMEIKPGDSISVDWITAPRRLKPAGYFNTTPTFPDDGLYSVRAEFVAITKEGKRILLTSNDVQVSVGGNLKMPKYAVAQIVESDRKNKIVKINLGSDHKIEPNDKFMACYGFEARWDIVITEVADTTAVGTVDEISQDRSESRSVPLPDFPQVGLKIHLLPVER